MARLSKRAHREQMAVCFNGCWEFLERARLNPVEQAEMLHLAHSARYHAGVGGTARNRAIGDWQVSRVYAALGDGTMAIRFANACRATCRNAGLSDLYPTALEALARAHAVAGHARSAERFIELARRSLASAPVDDEGREVYRGQLVETERLARRLSRQRGGSREQIDRHGD